MDRHPGRQQDAIDGVNAKEVQAVSHERTRQAATIDIEPVVIKGAGTEPATTDRGAQDCVFLL